MSGFSLWPLLTGVGLGLLLWCLAHRGRSSPNSFLSCQPATFPFFWLETVGISWACFVFLVPLAPVLMNESNLGNLCCFILQHLGSSLSGTFSLPFSVFWCLSYVSRPRFLAVLSVKYREK